MSKEIDEQTMGGLAAGRGAAHDVRENTGADVLLSGHVLIRKDPGDLLKATELRAAVDRAIATLRGLAALVVAAVAVLGSGLMSGEVLAESARPTWTPRPAVERSWGDLTASQLVRLHAHLRQIKSAKVEIYCGGNFCRGLAEDLDEAFESAGHDAYLEAPMFDLGKGIGISPDTPATRAMAAAVSNATGGAVTFKVLVPRDDKGAEIAMPDKVVIGLGRKPRVSR
jgi:hypothetical protein